jgi:hypothetical protein
MPLIHEELSGMCFSYEGTEAIEQMELQDSSVLLRGEGTQLLRGLL